MLSDEQARSVRERSPVAAAAAAAAVATPPTTPALKASLPLLQPRRNPPQIEHSGYLGHFVLLCGFDNRSNSFALRDPDGPNRVRRVSAAALDEARAAFGTDEDLLIIELARERPASCVSVAFAGAEAGRKKVKK